MMAPFDSPAWLRDLNPAQRAAVDHGEGAEPAGPLLILAGAGTGKTNTLAHRVARLVVSGADPRRILLLTFTRRAAAEMIRRAQRILGAAASSSWSGVATAAGDLVWAGTFHGIGNRLLRQFAEPIGLDPAFTVLDRADAADLMGLVRQDMGLGDKASRFPRKDTCLAIYSLVVNAGIELERALETAFPWCADWADELRGLFGAYVAAKQRGNTLDYDDLLLWWAQMMGEPQIAAAVGALFDHVLVDEYQDTNALQASVLFALKPDGRGVTVVGDDAQSIYAFRAATVRNILDFPERFAPPARVVTLEENYRSTLPILEASNAVIGLSSENHPKQLVSSRLSDEKPQLVGATDEAAQVGYVVARILAHREAGIDLKRQAVLFRASHHSAALEIELTRRDIPFVKFGGLKFLEAAHVKDVVSILRWAENPRDAVAAFRTLQLMPGIGPGLARKAYAHLGARGFDLGSLAQFPAPGAAAPFWPGLVDLLGDLRSPLTPWAGQVGLVRGWYEPVMEGRYDQVAARIGDLERMEQIAAGYATRERFVTELTLDPPDATSAEAGVPLLDEDYLTLSTIHSAKGQEWDAVFVINANDGNLPSDLATGERAQIEEERRLLYVAMTRARQHLHIVHPHRFYKTQQHRHGDAYVFAPRTRFIPNAILDRFEVRSWPERKAPAGAAALPDGARVDVGARMRDMWR